MSAIAALFLALTIIPSTEGWTQQRDGSLRRVADRLSVEPNAFLEPVTSYDFEKLTDVQPKRSPVCTTAAPTGRGSLVAGFPTPPSGGPPVSTVRREIRGLWRFESSDSGSLTTTRVDYDVVGANGELGVLSHIADPESTIEVRVVELPLRQVGRPGSLGTVEGGVMLEMDLRQTREAGHYSGTLRITVLQI